MKLVAAFAGLLLGAVALGASLPATTPTLAQYGPAPPGSCRYYEPGSTYTHTVRDGVTCSFACQDPGGNVQQCALNFCEHGTMVRLEQTCTEHLFQDRACGNRCTAFM